MREQSQRQLRVGEQIKRGLSTIIARSDGYGVAQGFGILIIEVSASPDLKHAKVFIDLLGNKEPEEAADILNKQAYFFQKELAKMLNLRYTPKLVFAVDTGQANARHISSILERIIPSVN